MTHERFFSRYYSPTADAGHSRPFRSATTTTVCVTPFRSAPIRLRTSSTRLAAGFESVYAFSRQFKRETRLSPRAFRFR